MKRKLVTKKMAETILTSRVLTDESVTTALLHLLDLDPNTQPDEMLKVQNFLQKKKMDLVAKYSDLSEEDDLEDVFKKQKRESNDAMQQKIAIDSAYTEMKTHSPHMSVLEVTAIDKQQFANNISGYLKKGRGLYIHLDHPNKDPEKKTVGGVKKGDLGVILSGTDIDEEHIDRSLSSLFFIRNKSFDCAVEMTESFLTIEIKANGESKMVRYDIAGRSDNKKVKLLKYLGPTGEDRDILSIVGQVSNKGYNKGFKPKKD